MNEQRIRPRNRFQFEMSILDTPITRALNVCDYKTAIDIIINSSTDPGILDEGSYERFPLFIVLSGLDGEGKLTPPNLQIVQLLLKHGAQPNKRGTVYHSMEGYRHSQSPMELLVSFFSGIQTGHRYNTRILPVIGLDGSLKTEYADIRKDLLAVMDIFIGYGGRLHFGLGILGLTPIVDLLWLFPDTEFLSCLFRAGADINSVDVHGRTALHVLIQAHYPEELRERRLQAITYLIKNTNVEIQKMSCKQHSCLWSALKSGHFDAASLLLTFDPTLDEAPGAKVFLTVEPESCEPEVMISERLPIPLIPFVADRDVHLQPDSYRFPNALTQETHMLNELSRLVDKGHFNNLKTESGIMKLLNWHRTFQMHNNMLSNLFGKKQFIPFLFGRSCSKLKILCSRQIFESCLVSFKHTTNLKDLPSEDMVEQYDENEDSSLFMPYMGLEFARVWCNIDSDPDFNSAEVRHSFILSPHVTKPLFDVTLLDLKLLLESLNLPSPFKNVFEFELYRRKLLIMLAHSDSDRVTCTCLSDYDELLEQDDMDTDDSSIENESEFDESDESEPDVNNLVAINFLQ